MNHTELVAALINQKEDLVEGIVYAQQVIEGSLTLLVMTEDGRGVRRTRPQWAVCR